MLVVFGGGEDIRGLLSDAQQSFGGPVVGLLGRVAGQCRAGANCQLFAVVPILEDAVLALETCRLALLALPEVARVEQVSRRGSLLVRSREGAHASPVQLGCLM